MGSCVTTIAATALAAALAVAVVPQVSAEPKQQESLRICLSGSPSLQPVQQQGYDVYLYNFAISGTGSSSDEGYFLVAIDARGGTGWVQGAGGLTPRDLRYSPVRRPMQISNVSSFPMEIVLVRTGGADGMSHRAFQKRARDGVPFEDGALRERIVSAPEACVISLDGDDQPVVDRCLCAR